MHDASPRRPRAVRLRVWAGALVVAALLAACGHAAPPAPGPSSAAHTAGPSASQSAPPPPGSATSARGATGAALVSVQKAKIQFAHLARQPQNFSLVDPLRPRTGAAQDVFAVSTPTAQRCSTGPGPCGSVL